jgi:hypothetical protein
MCCEYSRVSICSTRMWERAFCMRICMYVLGGAQISSIYSVLTASC